MRLTLHELDVFLSSPPASSLTDAIRMSELFVSSFRECFLGGRAHIFRATATCTTLVLFVKTITFPFNQLVLVGVILIETLVRYFGLDLGVYMG
jgi:hypothetical protein